MGAVAAVLSDHQAPAHGVERVHGIGVAEGEAVGEKRPRERPRVIRSFGNVDQALCGSYRVVAGPSDRQCEYYGCPRVGVNVATACEPGAAQLDIPFGLAAVQVGSAKQALEAGRHVIAATADNRQPGFAVADSGLDASGRVAVRRHHIQERKSGMVDGQGRFD